MPSIVMNTTVLVDLNFWPETGNRKGLYLDHKGTSESYLEPLNLLV